MLTKLWTSLQRAFDVPSIVSWTYHDFEILKGKNGKKREKFKQNKKLIDKSRQGQGQRVVSFLGINWRGNLDAMFFWTMSTACWPRMQIIGSCLTDRLERGMHKQKDKKPRQIRIRVLLPCSKKKQSYKISRKKNLGDNEKAFEQT